MSNETQAVLLNAVPLLVLGATYLAVTTALAPRLVRERRELEAVDLAVALLFPATAVLGLVLAGVVLHEQRSLGASPWPAFGAIVVAMAPAMLVVARWEQRARVVGGARLAREAEARVSLRDRELRAVAAISNALVRTQDEAAIGRVVCDEVAELVGIEFAAVVLVDQAAGAAEGLVARRAGADLDWWAGQTIDLREPSGIASAVFEGAPVQVYDTESSALVSRRLAELVGAKSGAWVPMVAEARVIGVLVLASTDDHRAFTNEELDVLQAIASEAALALDRARAAGALGDALERERLVAEISRKVRSELDTDGLVAVAVEETGRALQAARCLIRLGGGDELALAAEWFAPGLGPVGDVALLPESNLAGRERRTIVVDDVATAPELEDPSLGGREPLLARGTRAVVAAPIVVFDRLIGVFSIHHAEPRHWTPHEVALVEAVAREAGLALHTARLLDENRSRLGKQAALLHAAQVLASELELDVVLERLVGEVARLLEVDGADCYLLDPARGVLRCAAVHGLDPGLIGFEFPAEAGLAGRAITEGRPVRADEYAALAQGVPSPAYEGFAGALVAPIAAGDEVRGVLGVGVRDGARRFDDDDVDVLGTLAGLAALALRNAESFRERSRQARIQRGFFLIADVLGEPLSLAQTIDAIAQAAAQALGGGAAAVLLPGPVGVELAGAHGLPEPLARRLGRRPQLPALLDAGAARRVLASSRLAEDDRFDEDWRAAFAKAGVRSLLAIPVEAPRGDEAAVALVLFQKEHRFVDDDLDLARQVARAARGALERAELYEAERSSRTLAQQLAQTGTLLATELDPPAVLEEVAEQAAALLGADAASIRSLEGDELVVAAGVGDEGEAALAVRTPSTAWPAGDVVHARAPVAIGDVGRTGRTADGEPVLGEGFSAYLGVPLYGSENALHGVLAVYSLRPRSWREEEIEALTALAANASVALSNAELYQRVALERELSVTILANIADGIVAVDRDGRIVLWNAAAAQITGVPADEAIGRTPTQVLQRELESDGGTFPGGARLVSITRAGEEIWLSLSEAVMRDPVGAVAGRIFAFRDISSERIVEQMKSDFVSTVSHELRTPLTSIYGFAETLLRQDVDFGERERRTFLGYIASESARLTSIVDALLNVARLDTGDLTVQLQPTDVGAVVRESVTAAQSAAEGNGHSFVLDLDDGSLTAEADAEKLRQILDQLIQNAVNFSPDGSAVTVTAHRRPEAVEVSVVDEGAGIPQSEQQRIFTKFYRGDGGQRGPGGAGLGLFIAQGLVAAMGGRIWVESGEGRGSAFRFELPAPREGE